MCAKSRMQAAGGSGSGRLAEAPVMGAGLDPALEDSPPSWVLVKTPPFKTRVTVMHTT